MSLDDGSDYAFDGMHMSVDHIITNDDVERSKFEELERIAENKRKLIQIVSGTSGNNAIKDKLTQYIINMERLKSIHRYANIEKLPDQYLSVAKEKNGLKILITTALKSFCFISINSEINKSIEKLIDHIYKNDKQDIAYIRVSQIQTYIHNTVRRIKGKDPLKSLPKKEMRDLLSACRLHLNLRDINTGNSTYIFRQVELNQSAYDREMATSVVEKGSRGSKLHWKARHFNTLLHFSTPLGRENLNGILSVDTNISEELYIENILNVIILD